MKKLSVLRPQTPLSTATAAAILALTKQIWPPSSAAPPPDIDAVSTGWQAQESAHFVIEDANNVLAHARIFRREIITTRGPLTIGALAAVCVHPDYRGRGWGADVVRAAFAYLPEMNVEVALFQTGVPQFYEKLGCRLIDNRFHNGGDYDNRLLS